MKLTGIWFKLLGKIDIVPGEPFDSSTLSDDMKNGLKSGLVIKFDKEKAGSFYRLKIRPSYLKKDEAKVS